MNRQIKHLLLSVATASTLIFGSCTTPKNVTYFQEFDPGILQEVAVRTPFKVKPDDKLSIMIYTSDDQLNRLFNLGLSNVRGLPTSAYGKSAELRAYMGQTETFSSYTVSADGTITMPVLGELKVEGMTREQVAGFIQGELEGRKLAQDPTVIVEFLNLGVNVMGEVGEPGRYDMNANKLTVLDALTLAGDLTINADRKHIKVLREKDGKMEVYGLDITKGKDLIKSPAYYLEQGDIVYVEPNAMRKRSTVANGNQVLSASLWVSVASVLTSAAVLIFK